MEENKYIVTLEVTIFAKDSDKAIEKAGKLSQNITHKNNVECELVALAEKTFNRTINIDLNGLD